MRVEWVRRTRQVLLSVIVLGVLAAGLSLWQGTRAGAGPRWLRMLIGPPQTFADHRIGIVAGHAGNDAGAVCPDGLTEAEVNQQVAEILARELAARGAEVDLLAEFDERLVGYRADAFISIHTDSCATDLSGFKVAGLEGGSAASDALTACLWRAYEDATGLQPHPDTITYDMRDYHAFREIAPDTPAAIIEIGFLNKDRGLLTRQPTRVAEGIRVGLGCFLAAAE